MKEILQHIVDDLDPDEHLDRVLTEEELSLFQRISEGILLTLEGQNKYVTLDGNVTIMSNDVYKKMEEKDLAEELSEEQKRDLKMFQEIKDVFCDKCNLV